MNTHSKTLRTVVDFNNHFMGASPAEPEFDLADYLRGVANLKTTPAVKNALSTGTDAAGGYSVPTTLMPGIFSALVPASACLQAGAGVVIVDQGAKSYSIAGVNANPTPAWRMEGGNVATSDPAFTALVAIPRDLSFMVKVSRELLADAVGLSSALERAIAQACAKELDRVALRGSGTAPEPRGLRNTPVVQILTNGANGLQIADYRPLMLSLRCVLQLNSPKPTVAIMSPKTRIGFGSLVDFMANPLQRPSELVDVQFLSTSVVPDNLTVGASTTTTEIYMGDWSTMTYVIREGLSIQLLAELYAGTGEVAFAVHLRADVLVSHPEGFVVQTGLFVN